MQKPYYQDPSRNERPPGRKANLFVLLIGLVPLLAMAGLVLARWMLYGVWPWK